jgi:hypothetical protein
MANVVRAKTKTPQRMARSEKPNVWNTWLTRESRNVRVIYVEENDRVGNIGESCISICVMHHYVRGLELLCMNSMNWNSCKNRLKVLEISRAWRITDKAHMFHNQTKKIESGIRGRRWSEYIEFYVCSIGCRPLSSTDSSLDFVDEPNDSGGMTRCGDDWGQGTHSPSSPQTQHQIAQMKNWTCFNGFGFPLRKMLINN